jgi:allophanate hydrolase
VPAGFQQDGLPFGVTLVAPAHQDVPLLHLAERLLGITNRHSGAGRNSVKDDIPQRGQNHWVEPLARTNLTQVVSGRRRNDASPDSIAKLAAGRGRVAVCGAHLAGLPLNHQLTSRGAHLVARTHSSPDYKLYALPGGPPYRPGMVRVPQGGSAIEVEVWEMADREFGSFVTGIPAPLGIGTLTLADGSSVTGFICEQYGVQGAEDISHFGGWRAYLAQRGV